MGRTECSTDTFGAFSVTCDLFGVIQKQAHRKEICCPGYMFFLQRNLGPSTKGTLLQNSEPFSDSPISSQIKQETYSQLCIIPLWDLIHSREPVNLCKQRCIEMNSSSQNAPNLVVMNHFSYLWRCKSVLCEYWCALGYCQLVLWNLKQEMAMEQNYLGSHLLPERELDCQLLIQQSRGLKTSAPLNHFYFHSAVSFLWLGLQPHTLFFLLW